jgi:hypothetical protein
VRRRTTTRRRSRLRNYENVREQPRHGGVPPDPITALFTMQLLNPSNSVQERGLRSRTQDRRAAEPVKYTARTRALSHILVCAGHRKTLVYNLPGP